MRTRWLGVCLAAALTTPAQVKFKTTTSLVNVGFSARDAAGHLVEDLKAGDLELFQDGTPQKLAFFARSLDLPLTLGIVMDVSGSQSGSQQHHAKDLEAFLRTLMKPGDRAFLVCFGNRLRLVSDYTPSGPRLLWTLQHFSTEYTYFELGPAAAREEGTALFDAIYYAVRQRLEGQNGRRALLLFSDGEDNSSAMDEGEAVEAAEDGDTTVYTIRYTEARRLAARDQYGIRVMDRIAAETGGEAVDAGRLKPAAYLPRIEQELRTSYELAYYPAGGSAPGYHTILIRCRRPGVVVRSRQGFTAPAISPTPRRPGGSPH